MSTITKERLEQLANFRGAPVTRQEEQELARIALASLEAEGGLSNLVASQESLGGDFEKVLAENIEELYVPGISVPPAPVSVPDEVTAEDCPAFVKYDVTDADEAWARGFNACRNAMLQGADRPQNEPQNIPENIPATQFKPVADLYGLTSPTGGETSFTFDAVEARDFIDGGWSCQEYVELERFQEAVSGNSPVIPGCSCLTCRPLTFSDSRFVVCPECGNKRCPHANDHRNACTGSNEPGQDGSAYPAAPQQEA